MFNIVKYTQKIKNGNKTGQWIPDLKNKINTLVSARYLYSNHSDRGTAIDENFELKGLSNIQSCVGMFRKQTELESIEANFENCINCQNMFYDCSSLKFIKLNLKNLSGETILNTVKKHKVTHIFAVPMVWDAVYKAAIAKIKDKGDAITLSLSENI